jgi:hypothetical protein
MDEEVICIDVDEPSTRHKKQKKPQRTAAQSAAAAAALKRASAVDPVDLCSTEELDDEDYCQPPPQPKQKRRKAAAADLDEEGPRYALCTSRVRVRLAALLAQPHGVLLLLSPHAHWSACLPSG